MLLRALPLSLAALASACAAGSMPEPSSEPVAAAQPKAPVRPSPAALEPASLADIAGEWDVVEFDGYAPLRLDSDGLRHAFVDIGPRGLSFTVGCNFSGMGGSIVDGVLVPASPDDGMETQMGCGPEREARDRAFFGFFRSRPRVTLLPDGRLRMEGAERSLLLERADIRRLAYGPPLAEIVGTWRVIAFFHFREGGHQGWGAMFAPGRLVIEPSTMRYSRCPEVVVRFRYTADFTLFREAPPAMPPRPCAAASPAATQVEPMLAALLTQSPHAERVPGGRYILRSRDYAVVLATEEDYRRTFGEQAKEWERRPG